MKRNEDVKKAIVDAGLKFWQVAYAMRISDATFSRKLRVEMKPEEKQKINDIIATLVEVGE